MTASSPTVCMINHNGEAYLERSIEALLAEAVPLAEIIIVDDASTDRSRELVRERFPQVRLVAMSENKGAAAARNVALREASTALVVLIDNDVVITPGSLQRMIDALCEHPDAAVIMPSILFGGDESTVQYDGANAHFLGQQGLDHEGATYGAAPLEERVLDSVVSACILVDRSRFPAPADGRSAPPAFDEDFFIYFEDHDFGYRTRASGRDVLAVPAAFCYHGVGTPELSIRATGSYSRRRVFFVIRNRWLFLLKNYSVRTLVVLAPMLVLYEAIQLGGVIKKGWFREWLWATFWVMKRPRSLLRKRRMVQGMRRVRDGALLRGGPVPLRQEATTSSLEKAVRRVLDAMADRYWRLVRGWV